MTLAPSFLFLGTLNDDHCEFYSLHKLVSHMDDVLAMVARGGLESSCISIHELRAHKAGRSSVVLVLIFRRYIHIF